MMMTLANGVLLPTQMGVSLAQDKAPNTRHSRSECFGFLPLSESKCPAREKVSRQK